MLPLSPAEWVFWRIVARILIIIAKLECVSKSGNNRSKQFETIDAGEMGFNSGAVLLPVIDSLRDL